MDEIKLELGLALDEVLDLVDDDVSISDEEITVRHNELHTIDQPIAHCDLHEQQLLSLRVWSIRNKLLDQAIDIDDCDVTFYVQHRHSPTYTYSDEDGDKFEDSVARAE